MKKAELESLAANALSALVAECGGSLEVALDEAGIHDPKQRQEIKDWFGWDEEECYWDD